MGRAHDATAALLEERPALAETVETLVERDTDGPWEFDDVDCSSGDFGEIVSRDFVESVDDGYRLVDRQATMAALRGEMPASSDVRGSPSEDEHPASSSGDGEKYLRRTLAVRDRQFTAALVGALGFLVLLRVVHVGAVFRNGAVVLPGNDPYHFKFWVDRLLASDIGPADLAAVGELVPQGTELTYATGWWLTALLEGSPETAGVAIALLPVIATLVLGVLVAWMALAVTGDERITVFAVVLLAAFPGQAQYSLLGFFDHHALDHVWQAGMAASLVWLARDRERVATVREHLRWPGPWLAAVAFGIACLAAMMTWKGAPLLLIGVGLAATLRSVSDIRANDSPLLVATPLLAGLGVATLFGHLIHTRAGWQEAAVVYAPAVVLFGVAGVASVATVVATLRPDPRIAIAGDIAFGMVGMLAVRDLAPSVWSRYAERFWSDLVGREAIVETRSLISPEFLLSFSLFQQFGLLLFFALPALGYASWRCWHRHEPRWLVLLGFGWPTLGLLCFQVRFTGEFAAFGAIFGAVGVFMALVRLEAARPLACFGHREARTLRLRETLRSPALAGYVAFVLVVIVTVGAVYTVALTGALAISDEEYAAAAWVAEDTDGDEYVLSRWGRSRMYNYFAWGGGDSDRYARPLFRNFLSSADPDRWYREFARSGPASTDRVGYVVVQELDIDGIDPATTYHQLFVARGSATQHKDGVGHFRLVYLTPGESQAVFEPVAGAQLVGSARPGTVVTVATDVSVGDTTFTYRRRGAVDGNGTYSVRVPYPGTYELPDGSTVTVTEADVTEGREVRSDAE